jgi:hypothetical protein
MNMDPKPWLILLLQHISTIHLYSPEEIDDLDTAEKWPGTAACRTEAGSDVMPVEEWPGTAPRGTEAESAVTPGKEWPDTTRRG